MKYARITMTIAAMGFLATEFAAPLLADDADDAGDAATIAMLTSGSWLFKGKKWSNVATFRADKTLTELNLKGHDPKIPITWQISGGKVILDFGNYKNTLSLPLDPKGTKGATADNGAFVATKVDPAELAPGGALSDRVNVPKTPVTSEEQGEAADLVKTYHNGLVTITGGEGTGSGFIAVMGDSTFLVTNAHVLAAIRQPVFKNLDGTALPAGDASLATGADAVRLETHGGKPFVIMDNVDQNAAIGDDVAVLGSSQSAGVVTPVFGKITGIGPNLVQISAQIDAGDSGSPIIHLKSGKVIAVATYIAVQKFDAGAKKKLNEAVDRRVGYRLDNVKAWQPVKWPDFYAQADAVGKLDGLTGDLYAFYIDFIKNGHPTTGKNTNPLIKDRIDQWIKDKGQLNYEDGQRADEMFAAFLKNVAQGDLSTVQPSITYDFFQRQLANTQQVRSGMAAAFEKLILHNQ